MIDGNIKGVASYGDGAIIALTAIIMVFIVLAIIIVLTELVSKVAGKDDDKAVAGKAPVISNTGVAALPLNIDDEDATVACLVASIDLRNETKKNVQVLSVREVK